MIVILVATASPALNYGAGLAASAVAVAGGSRRLGEANRTPPPKHPHVELAIEPELLGAAAMTVYWQHGVLEARVMPLVTWMEPCDG